MTTARRKSADDFSPTFAGGDTNSDGLLDPGETWTYSGSGTVGAVEYCNVGTASGTNGTTATASDPACYRVPPPVPDIAIVKLVDGQDANTPAGGPLLKTGSQVTWTYVVTNPGTVPLSNVIVIDDNGTQATRPTTSARRSRVATRTATACWIRVRRGRTRRPARSARSEYCNTGTASGTNGTTATATDPACYGVQPTVVAIAIVKLVNGRGREHAGRGSGVTSGAPVTWTYTVTNPGTVPLRT